MTHCIALEKKFSCLIQYDPLPNLDYFPTLHLLSIALGYSVWELT